LKLRRMRYHVAVRAVRCLIVELQVAGIRDSGIVQIIFSSIHWHGVTAQLRCQDGANTPPTPSESRHLHHDQCSDQCRVLTHMHIFCCCTDDLAEHYHVVVFPVAEAPDGRPTSQHDQNTTRTSSATSQALDSERLLP
jgi:hypothetical protein